MKWRTPAPTKKAPNTQRDTVNQADIVVQASAAWPALPVPRVAVGGLAAAAAALVLLPAPTSKLWYCSVMATEWGYWLALPSLAATSNGWKARGQARLAAAVGAAAAAALLSPVLRAAWHTRDLAARLREAFGESVPWSAEDAPARPAPLVALDLVRGIRSPQVARRVIQYAYGLWLDLYSPRDGSRPAPCVVVVHGGSWQRGTREDLPELNRYLAARGYAVAAIDYRKAPQWPFPAAVDDTRTAMDYLRNNAAVLGIDANRLVLLGRSAGGQLALVAAYARPHAGVRGVISLYGPTDLQWGYDNPTRRLVMDSCAIFQTYLGGPPQHVADMCRAASPLHLADASSPPTLLAHGARDQLVWPQQSEMLADRLRALGRPHMLLRMPWAEHVGDVHFSGPSGQVTVFAVERFLAAVCAEAPRS